MDRSLRVKIFNTVTYVLVAGCLLGYIFGLLDPSPLFCSENSSLAILSRNVERSRSGTDQTHTVSNISCVTENGVSVPNNADKIFALVCVLPIFLLMIWGFASNLMGFGKKKGSAAQKEKHKQNNSRASRNQELEKFFRFTPDDLAQNKKGFVSDNQKKEIKRRRWEKAFKTLVFPALILIVLLVFLRFKGGMMYLPVLALYSSPVIAVIIGIIFFPVFKKIDFTLKSAQGKVNLVTVFKKLGHEADTEAEKRDVDPSQRNKTIMVTEMQVGGEPFGASDALLEIVHKGDQCCIYYIGSGDIISMEFLF